MVDAANASLRGENEFLELKKKQAADAMTK